MTNNNLGVVISLGVGMAIVSGAVYMDKRLVKHEQACKDGGGKFVPGLIRDVCIDKDSVVDIDLSFVRKQK